jgi:hypothetical protein
MTCAVSTASCARPGIAHGRSPGVRHEPDRAVRGRPGDRGRRDRRRARRLPLRRPRPLRRMQRHRADRGVLRPAQGSPAVAAREPADQPRHPHGRGHPGQPPAQRRPRLLRQETGRGQDPQRGPARAEAAGQRRRVRPSPGRRTARRSPGRGPGRATGERLCNQRGRLTPQAPALRASHSRVPPPPYDHGRQPGARQPRGTRHTWAFRDSCHSAAGEAAGPGGAPAAKRGRTTWRYGETTATLSREEGQEPGPLTQRGIRSARQSRFTW